MGVIPDHGPARLRLGRFARQLRDRVAGWWHSLGDDVECNCCGWTGRSFLPAGASRIPNRRCPRCGSLQRYRMLALFLMHRLPAFTHDDALRVLEVAPQACFSDLCRRHPHVTYVGLDLRSPIADVHTDLTRAGLASCSIDLAVCFHVLEHVRDDGAALNELRRVLRPGGTLVAQVPLGGERTFEDPGADPSDYERLFGQSDHVRYYGRDVLDRFATAGLHAAFDNPLDWLEPEVVHRHALEGDDRFLIVARRPDAAGKPPRVASTSDTARS